MVPCGRVAVSRQLPPRVEYRICTKTFTRRSECGRPSQGPTVFPVKLNLRNVINTHHPFSPKYILYLLDVYFNAMIRYSMIINQPERRSLEFGPGSKPGRRTQRSPWNGGGLNRPGLVGLRLLPLGAPFQAGRRRTGVGLSVSSENLTFVHMLLHQITGRPKKSFFERWGGTNVRDEMFFMRACVQWRRRWTDLVYSVFRCIACNCRKEPT
jgi:hypothetical protein